MGKQKAKYYVVWSGRTPGIYRDWASCKAQVEGVAEARYKAFDSLAEAETAFRTGPAAIAKRTTAAKTAAPAAKGGIIRHSLSVDAACSGNPGKMEYRGVITSSNKEVFRMGPYPDGTNNIGEFLAIVHGLAFLREKGYPQLPIYTDSRTALAWVRNKKANTKLPRTGRNNELFTLIARAEDWLMKNRYENPILKWETEAWGEIPADFGRK